MAIQRVCSLIDLLRVHEHRFAATTSTPTEGIANKSGSNSTTVKLWVNGKTLEVPKASSDTGHVVANDAGIDTRNAEP